MGRGSFFGRLLKVSVMVVLTLTIVWLAASVGGMVGELPSGDEGPSTSETGGSGGDGGGGGGSETGEGDGEPSIDERVEVLNHSLVRENEGTGYESVEVRGELENVGGETVSSVGVRVRFLDGNGSTLSVERGSVTRLSPGGVWEFEVEYPPIGEEAATAENYSLRVVS